METITKTYQLIYLYEWSVGEVNWRDERKKYLKEDKFQSITQHIIKKAFNDGILDLLDPSFVDNGKLQKAWDIIHKYELWIENIDGMYWDKLANLIDSEYKYILM